MRKNSVSNSAPPNAPKGAKSTICGEQPLFTIKEIAALDGVSEKTVRRAIKSGQLIAIRIGPGGRLLRISRQAHAAYRMACNAW